jgi:ferredoxin
MPGECLLRPVEVDHLVRVLHDRGYEVRGPVHRDGTILLDRIDHLGDLAVGRRLEQHPGVSRVVPADEPAEVFAAVIGPTSPRSAVLPARSRILTSDRDDAGIWTTKPEPTEPVRTAYIGLRACDLAALAIQDRVFTSGPVPDASYLARREGLFLVAVECAHGERTCFCASAGTGPAVDGGADLVLAELDPGTDDHRFLARALTQRGQDVLDELVTEPATDVDHAAAAAQTDAVAKKQTKTLRADAHDVLRDNLDSPHWEDVASRCLTCANCTLVCPTCFCTTVEDTIDLTGDHAERWRRWDSCFTLAYSHTAFGATRTSPEARYRQWLTHKLSTWVEQFGTSGCVGCGRCIAWCPVGIDLTVEVDMLADLALATRQEEPS